MCPGVIQQHPSTCGQRHTCLSIPTEVVVPITCPLSWHSESSRFMLKGQGLLAVLTVEKQGGVSRKKTNHMCVRGQNRERNSFASIRFCCLNLVTSRFQSVLILLILYARGRRLSLRHWFIGVFHRIRWTVPPPVGQCHQTS